MQFEIFAPYAFILLIITSTLLLLSDEIRLNIAAIGFQYLGVFAIVVVVWPVNLAAVKLVAGWLSVSILGISRLDAARRQQKRTFMVMDWKLRLFSTALIALVAASMTPGVQALIPNADMLFVAPALFLLGMGLLHNAVTQYPLQALLGILTVLSGFEIIYSMVEVSALVAGLLAVVNLGIAFIGAYLLETHTIEVAP
ncbi:MAG: hypothetical protein OEV06_00295 [Anaerolineae bacterium]|nr:hypothetical protein [Anaerolineae bacterium]